MTESRRLLAEYARNGSDAAFRELVAQYVDLVFSSALRLVDGDVHRAEDVSQTVFADLARAARTLPAEVMLGGWLHRHTCFVAAKLMRGERRRQARERQAAELSEMEDHSVANLAQLKPILDEAINQLGTADRTAILLRFFEKRDLRSVGEALGGSENAAQKRVARALEELRRLLQRRGVALSAAALGATLTANAVAAAPAGLAAGLATSAMAGVAAEAGSGLSILKIMAMTKLKAGIVGAVVVAGVGASLLMQQQAAGRLRAADDALQLQADEIAALQRDNERLAGSNGRGNVPASNSEAELLALRSELASLRSQSNNLARLQSENRQLQSSLAAAKPAGPTMSLQDAVQFRADSQQRMMHGSGMGGAVARYLKANGDQLPASVEDLKPYLSAASLTNANFRPDDFEIMQRGALKSTDISPVTFFLREKQARRTPEGRWERIYINFGGGVFRHTEPDGNFEEFEKYNGIMPGR